MGRGLRWITLSCISVPSLILVAACGSAQTTSTHSSPTNASRPVAVAAAHAGWSAHSISTDATVRPSKVSCAGSSFCLSIDSTTGATAIWNGAKWTSAPVAETGSARVSAVSCASPHLCQAVDNHGNVVAWAGSGWSQPQYIDTTPRTTAHTTAFRSVSPQQPAIEEMVWHSAPTNILADTSTAATPSLTAVSCPTVELCVAVDNQGNELTWTAGSWSPPVAIEPTVTALSSISCATDRSCIAVDVQGDATIWDGASWSIPGSVDGSKSLSSVSCPSDYLCQAVDSQGNAVEWNGNSWTNPVDIDGTTSLTAISCPSITSCVAVDVAGNEVTWSGSTWSAPVSLNGGSIPSVSCGVPSICQAVDGQGNSLEGPA